MQPERSARPWIADESDSGGGASGRRNVLDCCATMGQSEKLIVNSSAKPPLLHLGAAASLEIFRGKRLPSGWLLGRRLNAQPAIRVGARRLAQHNLSELLSWKTSGPNLPNGWVFNPPGTMRVARRFPKNRFMSATANALGSAQFICQPNFSGVVWPVFHFHISISNCLAKATIAFLRRRR